MRNKLNKPNIYLFCLFHLTFNSLYLLRIFTRPCFWRTSGICSIARLSISLLQRKPPFSNVSQKTSYIDALSVSVNVAFDEVLFNDIKSNSSCLLVADEDVPRTLGLFVSAITQFNKLVISDKSYIRGEGETSEEEMVIEI